MGKGEVPVTLGVHPVILPTGSHGGLLKSGYSGQLVSDIHQDSTRVGNELGIPVSQNYLLPIHLTGDPEQLEP